MADTELYYKRNGMKIKRIIEYRADGTVRVDQERNDKGSITINVKPEDIIILKKGA